MTTTTLDNLTDYQIERLAAESGNAGDMLMCAICYLALGFAANDGGEEGRVIASQAEALRALDVAYLGTHADKPARAAIVRVIRDAEAQAE